MDIYSKHFLKVWQSFPLDGSCRKTFRHPAVPVSKRPFWRRCGIKLVWEEDTVPAHFATEVLEELHGFRSTSCLVENKTLHEQTTTLEETFRVIPWRTGSYESLLSVHSVKDSDGKNSP
ncbi:hypothetical protein NXW27_00415 [Phocaeicola dorei]|nr:hypothetical protein [Phocaeicola dorei]